MTYGDIPFHIHNSMDYEKTFRLYQITDSKSQGTPLKLP